MDLMTPKAEAMNVSELRSKLERFTMMERCDVKDRHVSVCMRMNCHSLSLARRPRPRVSGEGAGGAH